MKKWYLLCLLACVGCAVVKAPVIDDKPLPVIPKDDIVLSFAAVGDNLIHGAVYHDARIAANTYDFTPMYEPVKEDIAKADIAFINQETILGGKAMGLSHYPLFNSPEEVAQAISTLGFDLVNHASNHSLDKGEKGILNAIATWRQYPDIVMNGIHDSSEAQQTIPLLKRNNVTIAFLAYTQNTNGLQPPKGKSYLVDYIDKKRIEHDVKKAKELADLVIVSMHWGSEDTFAANDYQKEYADFLHELKVDVVIGTHPHTIQPVAMKQTGDHQTLIIYSLGNFLSAQDDVDNMMELMMKWSIRIQQEPKKVTIENVTCVPLINHFAAGFKQFRVYKYKDYTKELLSKHGLQGYKGQSMTFPNLTKKFNEVLSDGCKIDL